MPSSWMRRVSSANPGDATCVSAPRAWPHGAVHVALPPHELHRARLFPAAADFSIKMLSGFFQTVVLASQVW